MARRTVQGLFLTLAALTAAALGLGAAETPEVPVHSFRLDNGMTFLVVRRPGAPLAAAGWAVRSGAAAEQPGQTGVAHLLEHLMHHGSRVIGTRSAVEELGIMDRQDAAWEELVERRRRGDPEHALEALRARLDRLVAQQRPLMVKGEYARHYTEAGAVGINALTEQDFTLYYLLIPPEKVELWFWMESDRLLAPVFRDFYGELEVVEEERRLRVESTPLGRVEEEIRAALWGPHPYGRPIPGWRRDMEAITREDARRFFRSHYHPGNLTAVLVGDLDPLAVEALARAYFGRLEPRPASRATSTTPPPRLVEERREELSCACRPQVRVVYRTPPFGHADAFALDVLAGVLNGRSGRLHTRLVLEEGIAFAAWTSHEPLARGGSFAFIAESRGGTSPIALIAAWDREAARIAAEPVPTAELERVKNQIEADAWRRLREPLGLALRLLIYDALGGWEHVDRWPRETRAVSAGDLQRVAREYLGAKGRLVATVEREEQRVAAGGAPRSAGAERRGDG